MYSSKIPTKSPGMLTHPPTLANLVSESIGSSSRLLSPADCPVLFNSLFCLHLCSPWDFPSLVLFQSRGKSRTQALCVGFVWKQTKESSDWHLPTPTPTQPIPTSCHNINVVFLIFFPIAFCNSGLERKSMMLNCTLCMEGFYRVLNMSDPFTLCSQCPENLTTSGKGASSCTVGKYDIFVLSTFKSLCFHCKMVLGVFSK